MARIHELLETIQLLNIKKKALEDLSLMVSPQCKVDTKLSADLGTATVRMTIRYDNTNFKIFLEQEIADVKKELEPLQAKIQAINELL